MKSIFLKKGDNRRKGERQRPQFKLNTDLVLLGESIKVTIIDYSFTGFGLIIADKTSKNVFFDPKLVFPDQEFKGQIIYTHQLPDSQRKLGFTLEKSGVINEFNNESNAWDHVQDSETVNNIIDDLVFKGPEAPIKIKQMFSRLLVIPIERTLNSMICSILDIEMGKVDTGPADFIFDLFQTCHQFRTNISKIGDDKIEFQLPSTMARLLGRETLRVRRDIEKHELNVVLKTSLLSRNIAEYEIYDFSEHGFSILDPKGEASFPKNLNFEEITFEIKGIGIIKGIGKIRNYVWNRDKHAFVVGFLFIPGEEPNLSKWHNFILNARYPNLDFNYQEEDHKKIWDLFVKSDYLHFKNDETFTEVIDLTKGTWKSLANSGTQIAKKAMIRFEDRIVGHIQMDRVFNKTWCLHHLAVDPDLRITSAQNLLTLTPDVLLSEGGEYVISFTDTSDTWNKKSYYDFIESYKFKDHNSLRQFQTYEVGIGKTELQLNVSDKIEITFASKYDIRTIQRFLQINYSSLEYLALDFESDPHLEVINSLLSKNNLFRERQFLVAKSDRKIVGISIIELGSEGINILGVFNCSYIYIFDNEDKSEDSSIEETLIRKSLEYYESRKIKYSLIFIEKPTQDYGSKGITLMCTANRWIAKKDVFSRFSAFTNLLYGHLGLRREKIRSKIKNK
jgi:hypothetical protein